MGMASKGANVALQLTALNAQLSEKDDPVGVLPHIQWYTLKYSDSAESCKAAFSESTKYALYRENGKAGETFETTELRRKAVEIIAEKVEGLEKDVTVSVVPRQKNNILDELHRLDYEAEMKYFLESERKLLVKQLDLKMQEDVQEDIASEEAGKGGTQEKTEGGERKGSIDALVSVRDVVSYAMKHPEYKVPTIVPKSLRRKAEEIARIVKKMRKQK